MQQRSCCSRPCACSSSTYLRRRIPAFSFDGNKAHLSDCWLGFFFHFYRIRLFIEMSSINLSPRPSIAFTYRQKGTAFHTIPRRSLRKFTLQAKLRSNIISERASFRSLITLKRRKEGSIYQKERRPNNAQMKTRREHIPE